MADLLLGEALPEVLIGCRRGVAGVGRRGIMY
jgi:hypothetical protein